jgi:hypothetical protein
LWTNETCSNEGDDAFEDEGNAVEYDANGVPKDDCYMWQQTVSKSNEENVIVSSSLFEKITC